MSMPELSTRERGSALPAIFGSFPSSETVSSSASIVAGGTDDQNVNMNVNENETQNLGISSAINRLGHDIGCDFHIHSSSSERSSISASPGLNFGISGYSPYGLQNNEIQRIGATTTNNAGGSSSPSRSSQIGSSRNSRASSKSNVITSRPSVTSAGGGDEIGGNANKHVDGIVGSTSPFGDFRGYESASGTGHSSESDDGLWNGTGEMSCPYCRRPYRQPRLLYCLHSFCEDCIVAMLEGRPEGATADELHVELEPATAPVTKPPPGVVRCPVCKQDSNVGNDLRFVQLLTMDYITMNMQDTSAMEHSQLSCESCKAKEPAVAHCFDCASFLCPNCVNAHQYMRCFDNHKVLTFEQIKDSGDSMMIHKPITCEDHTGEHMRYFCTTCKVPMCAKCTLSTHKLPDHLYEEIGTEMESKLRKDLEQLVKDGQNKVQACEGTGRDLTDKVRTVQERADEAVRAVDEAYNAYLEMLSRRRDELIQEIGIAHTHVEDDLTNTFARIGNMSEKIRDALGFTERLLRCGNALEILYTRKAVREQLTCLIRGIPSTNVAINLRFITDPQQFERAIKENFGVVRTEIEPPPIEHVNVDELLKCIDRGAQAPVENAMRQQLANSGGPASMKPFNEWNEFGAVGHAQFSTLSNACNTGYLGQANDMQGSGVVGSISYNGAGVPGRPPSCAPAVAMSNRPVSLTSPVDAGYGFAGGPTGSIFRTTGTGGTGNIPDMSVPPPLVFNSGTTARRTPPFKFGYDASTPLTGLQSVFSAGAGGAMQPGLTPPIRTGQMTQMETKARFGTLGSAPGLFASPHGFCMNETEEIAVADTNNHRIQVFSLNGELRFQFGMPGKEEGQLWYPRKIAYLSGNEYSPGRYVVCDRGSERSRMQLFTRDGHFVKKIAVRYIDIVAGLAIDPEGRIVAVDSVTPTVFCIDENGTLVRWFDCAEHMREPSDIAISGHEYFICDFKGHCVCVFAETGAFLRRVGCEGITNFPNGIDISDAGDVLIGDSHGNRFHVAVYRKSGELTCEFECPYAKVSRCCGLRITRDGYIVTIAKNNHNVLVLNTLFIA